MLIREVPQGRTNGKNLCFVCDRDKYAGSHLGFDSGYQQFIAGIKLIANPQVVLSNSTFSKGKNFYEPLRTLRQMLDNLFCVPFVVCVARHCLSPILPILCSMTPLLLVLELWTARREKIGHLSKNFSVRGEPYGFHRLKELNCGVRWNESIWPNRPDRGSPLGEGTMVLVLRLST